MITEAELESANDQLDAAQRIISQYYQEQRVEFAERMRTNPVFSDSELVYSRDTLCPCGHGLAYPAKCGPLHYWDCSAILKGIADPKVKHTAQLPFAFYDVKAEQGNQTTRGTFRPKGTE